MAAIAMVAAVVGVVVAVTSIIRAIVVAVRRALSACILIEAHLGFLSVGVLVGGCDYLADPSG